MHSDVCTVYSVHSDGVCLLRPVNEEAVSDCAVCC